MIAQQLPDPLYLRKRLRYDHETGLLFWKDWPQASQSWRTRYANTIAFSQRHDGYIKGSIDGKMLLAHRAAWAIYYGCWPSGQIDHINGNQSDNRIVNLRECSNAQNNKNKKLNANNTSGICGVSWCQIRQKWVAQAFFNGKHFHIGYFTNINDAAVARAKFNQAHGFSERHGI